MIQSEQIPYASVLGINYSGMHDSSIAIVAPDGNPIYAVSLERITRVKQDGRPPYALLEEIPWDQIAKVAVSTNEFLDLSIDAGNKTNPYLLPSPRPNCWTHKQPFYDFLNKLPCEKVFVSHQLSHASSAFWGSKFEEAICLTCDGGMYNDSNFGGVYQCSKKKGILILDSFNVMQLAMVTSLYTFVTALLGFTPNKHEGKITGLAAYGNVSDRCQILLEKWFGDDYYKIESTLRWIFSYSDSTPPQFLPDSTELKPFKDETKHIPREELAASVQAFAEEYVLKIIKNIKKQGWESENICLAGGLFSNVKINQRVVETGFKQLFVAPPMTDDGTALGAAWHVLSSTPNFNPSPLNSMYLGPSYSHEEIDRLITEKKIQIQKPKNAAKEIASILSKGDIVAIFQGAAEFGPRALGNRSILAPPIDEKINQTLNELLHRTEFMPFAPISRIEDAEQLYQNIHRVRHAANFMTVAVGCKEKMKKACPATVHIDGTARPQLISQDQNPLIHDILTQYQKICGIPSLINTSFNVHEEPIVSSPEDALRGFFISGLSYLYFDQVGLIPFKGNELLAISYLEKVIKTPDQKQNSLINAKELLIKERAELLQHLEKKELELRNLVLNLEERESLIQTQAELLKKYDSRGAPILDVVFQVLFRIWFRISNYLIIPSERLANKVSFLFVKFKESFFTPKLGKLRQYNPTKLKFPGHYTNTKITSPAPKISIVTPSFNQGNFIERTINSVLDQNYENLEYYIQDGGSNDATLDILKKYSDRLTGWESKLDNGQTHAINLGFAKTTGEIMAWLNSDDILLPGTLNYVADFFNCHPEIDVVYGNRIQIDENDRNIGRWIIPKHEDAILSWADFIPQETVYWRRSIWEKVDEKLDESFCFAMDWDFLVRLRDAGANFARLPRFMGGFRIHPNQKTSLEIGNVGVQEMDRIRLRLLGKTPSEKEIFNAVKPYLIKHIFIDMIWKIRNQLGNPY